MVTTSSTNSTKNGNFIKINSYNFYVLEIGPQIGDFVHLSSRQNVSSQLGLRRAGGLARWPREDSSRFPFFLYYKLLTIQSWLSTIMVQLLTIMVRLLTMVKAKVEKSWDESVEVEKVGSITHQSVKWVLRRFLVVNNMRWDCRQSTWIVNFQTVIVDNQL